jgi:amino acid permease
VAAQNDDMFYTQAWFYVLIIALLALPLCLKREIKELKWPAILLFSAIVIFIIVLIIELSTQGTVHNPDAVKEYY